MKQPSVRYFRGGKEMKIDELLKLPFFQKCIFKNYFNKQEILGCGDEIEDIDHMEIEEGEPIKIPTNDSTTDFFLQPNFINVVYCIKKEEEE
jgi:hypothetical protein